MTRSSLLAQGQLLAETGDPDTAAVILEQALAKWEEKGATIPYQIAGYRFELARALWGAEPEPALGIAREVLELVESTYSIDSPLRREMADWLGSWKR